MSTKLERYVGNPILGVDESHSWEAKGGFNPSVWKEGDVFHLLYRAVSHDFVRLPSGKQFYSSSIGYAKSTDGIHFLRNDDPLIKPERGWEKWGCEDPRMVKIDDTYYIFYTAITSAQDADKTVQIAFASSKDLITIQKHGFLNLAGRAKAASFFPEKVNGKFAFLYTQFADTSQSTIFYAEVDDPLDLVTEGVWKHIPKIPLLTPSAIAYRGPELGAPPLKTAKGWLLIYCPESFEKEWSIGAALLDLQNPSVVIARIKEPLLKPEEAYEREGIVPNVAFPSGALIVGDTLFIYYGGGDQGCCLAQCNIDELLSSIIN